MNSRSKIYDFNELRNEVRIFRDRAHAGQILAKMLQDFRESGALLLAIPSGGIPVAAEISRELNLPLLPLVASKITPSWNTEAGYGAVAFNGAVYLNEPALPHFGVDQREIREDTQRALEKVNRRMKKFLGGKTFPDFTNQKVILVDDGIAAGVTMRAAIEAARQAGASEITVASPTGHASSLEDLAKSVDAIYCPNIREGGRFAVAEAYQRWTDVDEDEALRIYHALMRPWLANSASAAITI